jgi:hypothetical protein
VFRLSFTSEDGHLHLGYLPGLGAELDEETAHGYPSQRSYQPFNRPHDGTVHDW